MSPYIPDDNLQQNDLNPVAANVRRKLRELEVSQNNAKQTKSEKKVRVPSKFFQKTSKALKILLFIGILGSAAYLLTEYSRTIFGERIANLISSQKNISASSSLGSSKNEVPPEIAVSTESTGIAIFKVSDVTHNIIRSGTGDLLTVTATLINRGNGAGQVDALIVTLLDKAGATLFSWPAPVANNSIGANSKASFEARLVEPPEGVSSVTVRLE